MVGSGWFIFAWEMDRCDGMLCFGVALHGVEELEPERGSRLDA